MFPDLLAACAALADGRGRTVELPERSLTQPAMDGDAEFFRVNALSLPCHRQDELPVGPMVRADSLPGDQVLVIAPCVESAPARAED